MKILIIEKMHLCLQEGLLAQGFEVDYKPDISRETIIETLHQYNGIVVRSKTHIDADLLKQGTQLKFIARAGAGMDNVDEVYAQQHDIKCIHAGGANANAVGEHATGMLLSLLHKINFGDAQLRKYIFDRNANQGFELQNTTIGIIGYGYTGSAFARKLAGFGVNVLAYDKYISITKNNYIKGSSLETIFEQADIISFHVPLNEETKHYANNDFINSFKKNIILMNLSRGPVLDTAALVENLKSGKIMGCCLDVFQNEKLATLSESEKLAFDYLITHPNSVLTPHVAGWSSESYEGISKLLLQKIVSMK